MQTRYIAHLALRVAKNLLLFFFLLFFGSIVQANAQGFQRIIAINADSRSIDTTLPYNQSILFRVKSKTLDLSKVNSVMILEHKGNKDAVRSIEGYNNEKRLQRKYYELDKSFNAKDTVLEVYLRRDPLDNFKRSGIFSRFNKDETDESDKPVEPPFVLFPSKQYSLIFFMGRDVTEDEKEMLELIRTYIDDSLSRKATAVVDASRTTAYRAYVEVKERVLRENGAIKGNFATFPTFVNAYGEKLYALDLSLLKAKKEWNNHISTHSATNPLNNDMADILIKLIRDTSSQCFKKFQCNDSVCKIYESLQALRQLADPSKFKDVVLGNYSLLDLQNQFFIPNQKITETNKLAYLDSTAKYTSALKLLVYNVLLDNAVIGNDGKISNAFTGCLPTATFRQLGMFEQQLTEFEQLLNTSRSKLQAIQKVNNDRIKYLYEGKLFERQSIVSADTYVYNFETRANYSIIPVFGYVYYGFQPGFNSFTAYTGLTFSLMHLDENVPFRLLRKKRVFQRVNFSTGLTLTSLKEAGKRDDFFGNNTSLLTGLGFKLSHVVTLNGGALWFRKEDPDPFITTRKVTATPYAALSINLKLKKLFEGFTSLVPLK